MDVNQEISKENSKTSETDSKEALQKLNNEIESLNEKFKNSKKYITNDCVILRNDINSRAESQIALLNKYKEELLNEIDKYESECNAQINTENKEFKMFQQLIEESKSNYDKLLNKLSDTDKIAETNNEIQKLLREINKAKVELDSHILTNKELIFEYDDKVNLQPSHHIGKLSRSNRFINYIFNRKPLVIKSTQYDENVINMFVTWYTDDELVVAVETFDSKVKLFRTDRNGKELKRIEFEFENKGVLCSNSLNDLIVVMTHIVIALKSHEQPCLKLYNKDLEEINEVRCSHIFYRVYSNDNNICVIGKYNICIYDSRLSYIKILRRYSIPDDKLYVLEVYLIKIKIVDDTMFMLTKSGEIIVLDKTTGKHTDSIILSQPISFDCIQNEFLITIENVLNKLALYSINGELIKEIILNDKKDPDFNNINVRNNVGVILVGKHTTCVYSIYD